MIYALFEHGPLKISIVKSDYSAVGSRLAVRYVIWWDSLEGFCYTSVKIRCCTPKPIGWD